MPVQYVEIDNSEDVGQRIDNYLMRTLKGVPRQHIYRILRSGEVRVNGGRVKPPYRVQLEDRIRIPPIKTRNQAPPRLTDHLVDQLQAAILLETDEIIALNKPSGLAVHGGSSVSSGLIEVMRKLYNNPNLELVHRLDRDTSGCLLLAKKRPALRQLQEAFRQRQVKKIYELFVHGQWPKNTRSVRAPLERFETKSGERRVRVSSAGQPARTDFTIIASKPTATHLQASLHTGRTHQIRVHGLHTGHAVLGDNKYGPPDDFERLCLHAKRLAVPFDGDMLRIDATVDDVMNDIWARL